jgi:hypothetical protein
LLTVKVMYFWSFWWPFWPLHGESKLRSRGTLTNQRGEVESGRKIPDVLWTPWFQWISSHPWNVQLFELLCLKVWVSCHLETKQA